MGDFVEKVVAIVGATSEIGAAAAIAYSKQGASLIICDSSDEQLTIVMAKCMAAGARDEQVISVVGDPTNSDVQSEVLKLAEHRFNRLDILVNALDTNIPGSPIPGIQLSDFKTCLDNNILAVANMCFASLRLLKESKGSIINVSSSCGQRPTKNNLTYCVSKAGLDMLTKTLALELASHGIRVNSVNPTIAVFKDEVHPEDEEFLKSVAAKNPMGRLTKVDEAAEAILFLSKASFITGQLLGVDGGSGL